MPHLTGKTVAILATDGFEQSELAVPLERLREAGAKVEIIAPETGEIRGWKEKDWGDNFPVDRSLSEARIEDYDALVLPGGQINPDILRTKPEAVDFVRRFYQSKKPLAAICHGPWMLIEADVVKGLRATSYHSIRTDMINAGADWVDEEVVVDDGVITSRNPKDLGPFTDKIIEEIQEGRHGQRAVA